MASANLDRKRSKLQHVRNGFQRKERRGFTKNHNVPRRYREVKRSILRRRHNHTGRR